MFGKGHAAQRRFRPPEGRRSARCCFLQSDTDCEHGFSALIAATLELHHLRRVSPDIIERLEGFLPARRDRLRLAELRCERAQDVIAGWITCLIGSRWRA